MLLKLSPIVCETLSTRQSREIHIHLLTNSIRISDLLSLANRRADEEGLQFFGIADLALGTDVERYGRWIQEDRHGSMTWMTRNIDVRSNPDRLLPGAKSVFVFGFFYHLGDRWQPKEKKGKPLIAQYARLRDYHSFLKKKVFSIQSSLETLCGPEITWRVTVDSAPVLERALAHKTGVGFIGKNTCFIHPQKGSFFLLAELFSTWAPNNDAPQEIVAGHRQRSKTGGCGPCKRCQVHCPTGALDEDYRIDARRCISYWTIEHRGLIPLQYWKWVGHYLFGCDICQLVCPYNRGVGTLEGSNELIRLQKTPDLISMATMNQAYYEKTFGGTPMTRAKISGLRRNAIIAAVVNSDHRILELLDELKNDNDPLVRGTADQVELYRSGLES